MDAGFRFATAALAALLPACASALASATSARAAESMEARGYARSCTAMSEEASAAPEARAQYEAERIAAEKRNAANPALAAQVAKKLGLPAPPREYARSAEAIVGPSQIAPGQELALLGDGAATEPRWWTATLAADGSLVSVAVAEPRLVAEIIGFPRFMAAYVLFNDLMGGDDSIPRAGCRAVYAAWFSSMPGVLPDIDAAIAAEPAPDTAFEARVAAAWNALPRAASDAGEGARLDAETSAAIGPAPAVRLVYRDSGPPGDRSGTIDVVRIGGARRTYVILSEQKGSALSLGGGTMCLVGDLRCVPYDAWP
jgi:hypothetical protein